MKKKILTALVLSGMTAALLILARSVVGFADGYYTYVYRPLATALSFVFGLIRYSVSELLLYAAILYVCFIVIRALARKICKGGRRKSGKDVVLSFLVNFLLAASCLMFLFTINCGVNYHKTGFAKAEGYKEEKYTKKQLLDVCKTLTNEINKLSPTLEKSEDGTTVYEKEIEERAKKAMQKLGGKYESLSGYYPNPKGLLVSRILSYQDVTGIYSPFTVEANYNADMPEYLKAFTMCHELSHLKGIMREEEANFVAFLACVGSDDDTVRYSGYMHAYTYCMNELYHFDPEAFTTLRAKLCKEADRDIQKKKEFWDQYDTKVATIANKMNDAYLKANAQAEGTGSYNMVTGLIVEYYQKQ